MRPRLAGGLFVAACVLGALVDVAVSASRQLSPLEAALFQVVILGLGLYGTAVFARATAQDAAAAVVRPHARSAFRRVLSLYLALGRIRESVETRREVLSSLTDVQDGTVARAHVEAALDLLRAQVIEQIGTADDAMEDWRDLVPDEVKRLDEQAAARAQGAGIGEA